MKLKTTHELVLRYLILILVALPNLYIFYKIFTPLTIYPLYFFFKIFFETTLSGTTIFVKGLPIEIINACIAGSAYYLLFVLNLALPKIKLKKRTKMIAFAFGIFLLVNLIRIIILSLMALSESNMFAITHKLSWYLLSVAIVVGIWFTEVKIFKIKHLPFYTDMKFLYKSIK